MAALDTVSLTAQMNLLFSAGIASDFNPSTQPLVITPSLATTTTGTGANQVNQYFSDIRSLNSSASETLDLYGGLTNGLGQTCNFTAICVMLFVNYSATGSFTIGGAASNQFVSWCGSATDKVRVRLGGFMALGTLDATAYAVANASTDNLKITNEDGSNSLTYGIVLIGRQ